MSQEAEKAQEGRRHWVGLDWGGSNHSVSVVDDNRSVVKAFTVGVSLKELQSLERQLRDVGGVAGIAIESTSNLVVQFLVSQGFTVYLVNPKLSKNWREGNSVAGVKSDARDGLVLAVELARRHESLRPLKQGDSAVVELAGLCETVRHLVEERTALAQRLKAMLRQYFPAVLDFFNDWTSPVAWRFLKQFPRPENLARTRKNTLCTFLKANRIGLSPLWLERIEHAGEAAAWPRPPDSLSFEVTALAAVAQLQALQAHIDKCDKLIAERTKALPQAGLLRSLPGAGERLAPALTAIAALMADEADSLQALRCLSGVAPVQNQSGKRNHTQIRRRCNKHWRNVLHLFAFSSMQYCKWAKAYFELCRERGDSFATALRKLADKWLRIINRMLKANEVYDEERYVESLRKKGSPIYAKLCG